MPHDAVTKRVAEIEHVPLIDLHTQSIASLDNLTDLIRSQVELGPDVVGEPTP